MTALLNRILRIGVGLCLAWGWLWFAQPAISQDDNQNDAPLSPEAVLAGGTITGRVTDADTGNGIAFAQVSINRYDDAGGFKFALTNTGGFFTLTNILTGVYAVTFDGPLPYLSERFDNVPRNASITPALIAVTSGFTATNIDAALRTGFVITGTVTDSTTSNPLSNVTVRAVQGDGVGDVSARTLGNGKYTLGPLMAGMYRLRFEPPLNDLHAAQWHNNATTYAAATPLTISGNVGDVNAALVYGSAITGSVSNANGNPGNPIEGVAVSIFPAGVVTPPVASATSGADGQFVTSPGLSPGVYQAFFAVTSTSPYLDGWFGSASSQLRASLITVTANLSTTNVNIQLKTSGQPAPEPGNLIGVVTTSGNPVPGVAVVATGAQSYSAYTGIDGSYRITSMRSGAYRVAFSPPGPFAEGEVAVSISPGLTTTNGNLALVAGGRITGTVRTQDTNAPMSGAVLRIQSATAPTNNNIFLAYVDLEGQYVSPGLPSGSYTVSVNPGASWGGYLDGTYATPVVVSAPNVTPNISFTPARGGTLSGFVCSSAHAPTVPLPSLVTVAAFNAITGQLINTTSPNAFGFYQLSVLAGSYKVRFGGAGLFTRWHANATSQAAATPVNVIGTADVPNIGVCLAEGFVRYLPFVRR